MKIRRIGFRRSLLTRYLLIILMALMFIPIVVPGSVVTAWMVENLTNLSGGNQSKLPYGTSDQITYQWHQEAKWMSKSTPEAITKRLTELKKKYKDASLFWVDHAGFTRLQLPQQSNLPAKWTSERIIQFMKESHYSDPFTVVALIGGDEKVSHGFMVLQLPRSFLKQQMQSNLTNDGRYYVAFFACFLGFFTIISYFFIRDIRKRLLRLESAMTSPAEDGLPVPIKEGKPDEIGMLEQAFNAMVYQLGESRHREREEEELRKRLISNLSHDLRTPLTVVGSHVYSLRQEELSDQGRQSLALMETKMKDLDHLIDHLLSYNLLTSGRYSVTLKRQDILRLVRESAAAWYPLWEKEQLEPDIRLPEEPIYWKVDEMAFRRVLDNVFQNIIRHASSGGYVGIAVESYEGYSALVIIDHGPGMNSDTTNRGAGLGLAIVDLLLRELKVTKVVESSSEGTKILLYQASPIF